MSSKWADGGESLGVGGILSVCAVATSARIKAKARTNDTRRAEQPREIKARATLFMRFERKMSLSGAQTNASLATHLSSKRVASQPDANANRLLWATCLRILPLRQYEIAQQIVLRGRLCFRGFLRIARGSLGIPCSTICLNE